MVQGLGLRVGALVRASMPFQKSHRVLEIGEFRV